MPERFGDRFALLLLVVVDGGGEELDEALLLVIFGGIEIGLLGWSGGFDLDGEDFAVGEELVGGGDLEVLADEEIEVDCWIQIQMIVRFDWDEVEFVEIVREGDSGAGDF